MPYRSRVIQLCVCLLFSLGMLSSAAFADSTHDRTQFGHEISVGPDEEVGEVTCFGCSVRVQGHVTGDITTFGGSIILEDEAEVGGDITSFAGSVRIDGPVTVDGDLTVFGGRIRRDPSSKVGGDVTNFGSGFWVVLIFAVPLMMLGAFIALIVWLVRVIMRPRIAATA
jgi:Polymer-forming cytoskeletal